MKRLLPGTSSVQHFRYAAPDFQWRCDNHSTWINPIWIRWGDDVEPACEACVLEELSITYANLEFAKVKDWEAPKKAPPKEEAQEPASDPPVPIYSETLKSLDDEDGLWDDQPMYWPNVASNYACIA